MKKIILATAYAVNPTKGSEDGMGWNFICQIARFNNVIAVTRENNRPAIEKYLQENTIPEAKNIRFLYYDLPAWTRFWKKGPLLSMIYYYMWQLFLPRFVKKQNVDFDIAHNLNFHNDWTPTFLWRLKKPLVWGPVGHHPKVPKAYLLPVYGWKSYIADRFRWVLKQAFWHFDPFLRISAKKAEKIICMNSAVQNHLSFDKGKMVICSSVASERIIPEVKPKQDGLRVLSVGRFVWLKGFDITIRSFAKFYHAVPSEQREKVTLTIVGDGPARKQLEDLAKSHGVAEAVTFIHWIKRSELSALYRESDVFLFPSHEGAGMVVAEAMSYGLPVLCFDNCGPGEFVNIGSGMKVGYSSYDESVQEFAKHLHTLHTDKELLSSMLLHARTCFNEKYEWSVKGSILKSLYAELPLKERIVCVHLLNDYSGSPLVLANAIKGFIQKGRPVELYCSSATKEGFLSGLNVKENSFWYRFQENKWKRLIALTSSQIHLFGLLLFRLKKTDTVYVNTLLPFGAALAARIRGVRVIYHLHETSMNPPVLKWFLKKVVKLTASHVVYVSRFLQEKEPVQGPNAHVVYNALSEEFRSRGRVHQYEISDKKKFTVLMLCSLKEYKGVNEFVTLARRLHLVRFELVLNSSKEEIEKYFLAQELPHNLIIFPKQKNVHPFYERAHLVLNLSHPDKWIETFGMTILEGMSYGIPELVPTVGGPVEIVEHGLNGYRIDVHDLDKIEETIRFLSSNRGECLRLSMQARKKAEAFSIASMHAGLDAVISN
ncbi:MAG TPA: glycosyltransferase [Bacteroidia bacterium]|nr:glycosyltransferase [Bacteroidia bacterium]